MFPFALGFDYRPYGFQHFRFFVWYARKDFKEHFGFLVFLFNVGVIDYQLILLRCLRVLHFVSLVTEVSVGIGSSRLICGGFSYIPRDCSMDF